MGPELPPVQAEQQQAAPVTPDETAPRKWLGRISIGAGSARPSLQETVLDLDGYGSARYLVSVEVGRFLSEDVALAGFALGSGRSDSSRRGGPELREESYAVGVALPLVVRLPFSNAVVLSPRFGAGFGAQSFHGDPEYRLCASQACAVSGSARQTQGLTADSIGFQLGPGAGSVVFPLTPDVLPEFFSSRYTVEVLIKGEGTTSLTRLSPNYEWQLADVGAITEAKPQSARVEISDGSRATIADLRLVRPPDNSCSVSSPGLRRLAPRHRSRPSAVR